MNVSIPIDWIVIALAVAVLLLVKRQVQGSYYRDLNRRLEDQRRVRSQSKDPIQFSASSPMLEARLRMPVSFGTSIQGPKKAPSTRSALARDEASTSLRNGSFPTHV